MARLAPDDYRIFKANVIKNSLNKADNYITLDRGSSDGIRPEMGVVDANGVVGIVYKTSPPLFAGYSVAEQQVEYQLQDCGQ